MGNGSKSTQQKTNTQKELVVYIIPDGGFSPLKFLRWGFQGGGDDRYRGRWINDYKNNFIKIFKFIMLIWELSSPGISIGLNSKSSIGISIG